MVIVIYNSPACLYNLTHLSNFIMNEVEISKLAEEVKSKRNEYMQVSSRPCVHESFYTTYTVSIHHTLLITNCIITAQTYALHSSLDSVVQY